MKKRWMAILLGVVLVLAACGGDKESDKDKSEESVGFSLTGESIEEAANVPKEEKEQILQAFNAYIETLNEKDIEKYLETLSENSYDINEERKVATELLKEYDLIREVSNITIVKYDEAEAQVYANMTTKHKQLDSGLETNPTGRQVTVFSKEEGKWKVSSHHYIGDDISGK